MVLSSITTIRPLTIPTDRKSKFSIYFLFGLQNTALMGIVHQLVLIAGKSPHQPDTNGQFILFSHFKDRYVLAFCI